METKASESLLAISQKIGLNWHSFLACILPPHAGLYLMGVLVQLEGTRLYRFALLPVIVWLSWRGAFVDMSGGNPKKAQENTVLMTHMLSIAMRATVWAFEREPYRRRNPSKETDKSDSRAYTAFWNAWDLMVNRRGIGWNWLPGVVLPKPAFETDSRIVFVLLSALTVAFHAFAFDVCIQTIRAQSPDTFGSLDGGSLFDDALPPALQLLRSVFVSFLTAGMAYFAISWGYYTLAIASVVVFRQRPSEWPPIFDSPWASTSLTELWGRRWHQVLRELFVGLGFRPFCSVFGGRRRLAGVVGAFLVSGVFHDVELRSFGRGGNSLAIVGFWLMQGVGVVLERLWKRKTGERVGGVWGWVWTFGWLAFWGVFVVDEWAKAGRFGALSLPGEVEPSLALLAFVRRCAGGS